MIFFHVLTFITTSEVFQHELKESLTQNLWSDKVELHLLLLSNLPEPLAIWATISKNLFGMFLRVTYVNSFKPTKCETLNPGIQVWSLCSSMRLVRSKHEDFLSGHGLSIDDLEEAKPWLMANSNPIVSLFL